LSFELNDVCQFYNAKYPDFKVGKGLYIVIVLTPRKTYFARICRTRIRLFITI